MIPENGWNDFGAQSENWVWRRVIRSVRQTIYRELAHLGGHSPALQVNVDVHGFDSSVKLLLRLLLSGLQIDDLGSNRSQLAFLTGQLIRVLLGEGFFLVGTQRRLPY